MVNLDSVSVHSVCSPARPDPKSGVPPKAREELLFVTEAMVKEVDAMIDEREFDRAASRLGEIIGRLNSMKSDIKSADRELYSKIFAGDCVVSDLEDIRDELDSSSV